MNKIFVAYKRSNISSNAFLNKIKKRYKVKKAGFSGTLDPFAKGCLIIAFNQYTKLFRFLQKTPKVYEATLWFGANSLSLDNKNITCIKNIPKYDLIFLEKIKNELLGKIDFIPPKFSAKKIDGKRAYNLAIKGENVKLKQCQMEIFDCKILHYMHPFLTIKISVSEGAYIRSYCELFAKKLGIFATLSNLERLSEGNFIYNNEKSLNVLEYLNIKQNFLSNTQKLDIGEKINIDEMYIKEEGIYYIEKENFFSIIEIKDNMVKYVLNKVEKC